MKRGESPAWDKAMRYVTDVASCLQPGARLPPLNRLARTADVSRATMWKSVKECVRSGTLVTRPGGGIYVPGARSEGQERDPAQRSGQEGQKWRRIAASIAEDIRTGVFRRDTLLPTTGELQVRYRVSYPTVAKSLKALLEQKQIIADCGRYRVPPLASSLQHKTIVFIARALTRLEAMPVPHMRAQECFSVLEDECLNAGIHVRPLLFDYRKRNLAVVSGTADCLEVSSGNHAILGFVLATAGLGELDFESIFSRIRRFGQPLVVLDEDRMLVGRMPPMAAARHYVIEDDLLAGMAVGRHLLQLGHRSIAYITPYHSTEWALRRYQGLQKACEEADVNAKVECFLSKVSYESRPDENSLLPARRTVVDTLRSPAMPAGIRASFQGQSAGLWHALTTVANRNWMGQVLTAPLESAARRTEITAWVASNDTVAVHCLEFLNRRSISVPRTLSVVGFDDSLYARVQGLTSYNFGIAAATHAMFSYMLSATRPARAQDRMVTMQGFVHERETTSPPGRR